MVLVRRINFQILGVKGLGASSDCSGMMITFSNPDKLLTKPMKQLSGDDVEMILTLCLITQAMLESIDVPLEKLKFVRGTEYQLNR